MKNVSDVVGYADITAAAYRTAVQTRQPVAYLTYIAANEALA